VNCGYCGTDYREDRSQKACKACPLGSDCGLILCPNCGYENPGMPRWIGFLRDRFGKERPTPPSTRVQPRRTLRVLDNSVGLDDRS